MDKRLEIRNTGVSVTDILGLIASGAGYSQIMARFPMITRDDIAQAASMALDIILRHVDRLDPIKWSDDDNRELIRLRSSGAGIDRLARIFLTSRHEIRSHLDQIDRKPKTRRGRHNDA